MANEEHLKLIKQGVDIWNAWREKNPEVCPDLSQADLRGTKLQKIDLGNSNLKQCKLQFSNFLDQLLIEDAQPFIAMCFYKVYILTVQTQQLVFH